MTDEPRTTHANGAIRLTEHPVNGITLRVAEQGSGPLVLLCHGWPESWYSWRSQIEALAAAGWRVAAPDMRGYGGSSAPQAVDQYTLLHLIGDLVGLVRALGERQAVIVGHDWGSVVAWHAALLRPDMFRAVAGLSVPYAPPSHTDLLSALHKLGITTFYMQYFQQEGVAEAELEADVRSALHKIYYGGSGDAPGGTAFGILAPGAGVLARRDPPAQLPPWLSEADLDYYTAEFGRAGFRGGLNWYRNLRRSFELLGPWRDQPIGQPSLFIAGERDAVLQFPGSKKQIESFHKTLPGLVGSHILEGAGHWIQRERAARVNELLLEFLRGLPAQS
ncbi:MAG: alpha/beta hydrolase [Pseudomonadota bacterium]|nr:alpha/beta hydrolase [Pseudomonadota bacterium]